MKIEWNVADYVNTQGQFCIYYTSNLTYPCYNDWQQEEWLWDTRTVIWASSCPYHMAVPNAISPLCKLYFKGSNRQKLLFLVWNIHHTRNRGTKHSEPEVGSGSTHLLHIMNLCYTLFNGRLKLHNHVYIINSRQLPSVKTTLAFYYRQIEQNSNFNGETKKQRFFFIFQAVLVYIHIF